MSFHYQPPVQNPSGLPYARSEMAIILDAELTDVPPRYQEEERATQLVNVLADAVERDGMVICPAKAGIFCSSSR